MNAGPFTKIIQKLSKNPVLEQLEGSFDALKTNYLELRERKGEGITTVSEALESILFDHMHIKFVTSTKLKYIYRGADSCFRDENFLGLAYFARAVLEHIGIYAYLVRETEILVERLINQSSEQKIHELLRDLKKSYAASYYGSSDPNAKPLKKHRPININDGIDALTYYFASKQNDDTEDKYSSLFHQYISREEIADMYGVDYDPISAKGLVYTDYDFLCNFVHPNFGSNYLVSSGIISEGCIDHKNDQQRNLGILFLKKCLRYWVYYDQYLFYVDAHSHMQISSWLERSYVRGAKLQRLFTKRTPKYLGDGKSLETAYTFQSARDGYEEWLMFSEMLHKEGMAEKESEIVDAGKEYVVYKIIMKNGVELFFKFTKGIP